jgi:cytochrome c oxidase cbb3-type subunit 4
METYTFLRYLADSWVLLILTLIFLFVIGWAFRPGSRALHDDAAAVPFRHDDPGCAKGCPDCRCAAPDFTKGPSHG